MCNFKTKEIYFVSFVVQLRMHLGLVLLQVFLIDHDASKKYVYYGIAVVCNKKTTVKGKNMLCYQII